MECDVAVLGGGPGGYTAAIRAAQLGAKTVCIEKEPELGGTCLRVGCIPTKAWVQTAFAIKEAEETFGKLGVQVGAPQLDFATANQWKDGVVKQMTSGVASLFKANGVEWVKGTGRFKDANTIAVEGGEDVSFKSAIVATGSFPLRPPIEGLDSARSIWERSEMLSPVRQLICLSVSSRSLRMVRMVSPMILCSCSSGVRASPFFFMTRASTSRNSSTLKGFLM